MTRCLAHLVLMFAFLLPAGCTSIRPQAIQLDKLQRETPGSFPYESYAGLLSESVDEEGWVNYPQLVAAPEKLDAFYALLSRYSPDSHPELFPTHEDRLAYWLNAYNATVLAGVLAYYPIPSVAAVEEPGLLFFFPEKSGFFLFQRFTYGGVETSLYYLENSVIRERFAEPRIHFALNCASRSCPRLPQRPFYPAELELMLDHEARRFINDPTRVRYDPATRTLYLSAIFDWYRDDFTSWLREAGFPKAEQTLSSYILIYLEGDAAASLARDRESVSIQFMEYDWRLNDRAHAETSRQ